MRVAWAGSGRSVATRLGAWLRPLWRSSHRAGSGCPVSMQNLRAQACVGVRGNGAARYAPGPQGAEAASGVSGPASGSCRARWGRSIPHPTGGAPLSGSWACSGPHPPIICAAFSATPSSGGNCRARSSCRGVAGGRVRCYPLTKTVCGVARDPDGPQRAIALLALARPPGKALGVRRGSSQGALRRAAGAGSKAPETGRTPANSAHGVVGPRASALTTATTQRDPGESRQLAGSRTQPPSRRKR